MDDMMTWMIGCAAFIVGYFVVGGIQSCSVCPDSTVTVVSEQVTTSSYSSPMGLITFVVLIGIVLLVLWEVGVFKHERNSA